MPRSRIARAMETWRLITTWGADPGFNMGLDEALLENPAAPPTLRFYSWKPDTLSLGYFQRHADVPAAAKASAVVRRITGGGAIHHTRELTFSIVVGLDHPLYRGTTGDSYVRVHGALIEALLELAVPARLRGSSTLTSDLEGTGMCFHHSTAFDIAWNERKGVGSAQRRRRGRVLHHGSIKLGTSALEGSIATIAEYAPQIRCESLAPLLRDTLARKLDLSLVASVPEASERERARELGKRFLGEQFVRRR